jgi:hypothetical protein
MNKIYYPIKWPTFVLVNLGFAFSLNYLFECKGHEDLRESRCQYLVSTLSLLSVYLRTIFAVALFIEGGV